MFVLFANYNGLEGMYAAMLAEKLTVSIAIVCRELFSDGNWPQSPKGNVSPFAKQLAVVVAVVLRVDETRVIAKIHFATHIDETSWTQE